MDGVATVCGAKYSVEGYCKDTDDLNTNPYIADDCGKATWATSSFGIPATCALYVNCEFEIVNCELLT